MYCNRCGQSKATLHYTQMEFGEFKELHLCDACAQKETIDSEQKFSVSDFLASITGKDYRPVSPLQCHSCGLLYEDFCETGRFGCSGCFEAFSLQVDDLLKRIHGSLVHEGKVLGSVIPLSRLKLNLEQAVQSEDYETAARIRDEIKNLESE